MKRKPTESQRLRVKVRPPAFEKQQPQPAPTPRPTSWWLKQPREGFTQAGREQVRPFQRSYYLGPEFD